MFDVKEKTSENEKTSLRSANNNNNHHSELPNTEPPVVFSTSEKSNKKTGQLCTGNKSANNKKYKTKDLNAPKSKAFHEENPETVQLNTLNSNQANLLVTSNDATNTYQVKINLVDSEKAGSCKVTKKTLKRPLPCLFAWTLLISATGVYFAFVSTELLSILDDFKYWIVIVVLQCVLFTYVVTNFLIATLRDPGRFPKVIILPDDPNFSDDTKSPLYKTITIEKVNIKIKWCSVNFKSI